MLRLPLPCALAALLPFAACGGDPAGNSASKPRVAFVTNCAVEFWAVAEAGVKAAAQANGVDVMVRMPPDGTAEQQQRMLQDVLAAGAEAVAVSPKDPDNMTGLLDDIAARVPLITHDSDAPHTQRLCYIGVDNYEAGRMCGQLVEEALPEGGAVVLIVGTLDQDNARRRRQGVIDHLLGREPDPSRFDAQDAKLQNGKYEIRATFTDQFQAQKAKAIAEDCLTRWQDVRCMVGLFAHEPPVILDAVRQAGRLDSVRIVGFDETDGTLQGIADGHIHGTIVQNPYEYGRRSVELMAQLLREPDAAKRRTLLPAGGVVVVPARQIRKADVAAFWQDLKQKTGKQ